MRQFIDPLFGMISPKDPDAVRTTAPWRLGIVLPALALVTAVGAAGIAAGFRTAPANAASQAPAADVARPAVLPRSGADAAVAIAQATTATPTAPRGVSLKGRPGERLPLTHDLVDMARSTGNYVIVNKAPAWVTVRPAESIGSGVWLVSPEQLASAQVDLAPSATGRQEISIAVVGPGGNPIAEAKLLVDVVTAAAPTVASQPLAPATTSVVTAAASVAAQAVASPAAAATAATPTPTKPAAPAAPAARVAQAPEPAKDGTKAWTEFLTGKPGAPAAKPGAAPAPKPAARPPSGARSEAELIGYAKHLVRECTTCHSLYGQDIGIPLMIGLSKDRFLDTMELYKIGKRDNVAMQSVAQSLNDEETLALALYLGRIKPPPQSTARAPSGSNGAGGVGAASAAAAAGLDLKVPEQALAAGSKDLERVERWLKRGRQMIDQGEISQARLLLTRATELGDPRAALMLASSYDPNVLPWRPGMGLEAEPARAKALYQLAIRLGAGAEAEKRLNDLP